MPDRLPDHPHRHVVISRPELARILHGGGLAAQLLPSDAGWFPRARGHRRERPKGCRQLVVMVCVAGRGWYSQDGPPHDVGPGQAVVLPPGRRHAYGADPVDPWSIWWVHLAGRQAAALAPELAGPVQGPISLGDTTEAVRLLAHLLATLERSYDRRRLPGAITDAWRLVAVLAEAATAPVVAEDGVARAIEAMHGRLDRPVTVANLAQKAGWSPSHFAARFRAATGMGVLAWFLRLRMQRAAWLLDNSDASVADVGRTLGYDDPFHFSRRFRAIHGCPPSMWRARHDHG